MKTKYKILIACTLVLSMLTAFAVTSFAAENTSNIVYDNNTYTYNETINDGYKNLQIWDYDSITIVDSNGNSETYDYDYVILAYGTDDGDVNAAFYNNGTKFHTDWLNANEYVNIILTGDYKYCFVASLTYVDNVTNINTTQQFEYDIFYRSGVSSDIQINILNNNVPNPLDKVNDFLGYLSTALNKLTTMIITNQILILFIVAVPVISFVIGSFKRIKDAGRV